MGQTCPLLVARGRVFGVGFTRPCYASTLLARPSYTRPNSREPASGEFDDFSDSPPTASLSNWIAYARGALRRHRFTAVTVFVAGVAASTIYFALSRPMYLVETRVLAQRPLAVSSAVRPAGGGDAPTRTAEELIRRRENLVDLVKRAGLLGPEGRDPEEPSTAFSWLPFRLGPDPAAVDPMGAVVARLDKALVISASDDTIRISIKWRNPEQAYHIVEGALQNFLEARQTQEITALDEGIALLQSRLATFRAQLDREEARRDDTRRDDPILADPGIPIRSSSPASTSAELARLKSLVDAKERAIRDMEDFRRRRLLDLQSQLEEKRNVYAEAHPVVIGLRKEVEGFSTESSQIAALREQERQLREQYAERLALETRQRPEGRAPSSRPSRDSRGGTATQDDRVKDVRSQYLQLLERVNLAQLELDAARAAFKHRYQVIWPAEVPRLPVSPNPWKIFPLGFLGALLLALLAAMFPDIRSRRIFETWQVERDLGLEVLSDVRTDRPR